jgi:hypothetical protein
MSVTRATIRTSILALQANNPPAGGGGSLEVDIDRGLAAGNAANQFERAVIFQPAAVPGPGFVLLNLQANNDVNNVNAVLTGVVAMSISWPATADGPLNIKPDVTEGWTALLSDASDVLIVQPGTTITLEAPQGSAYPVSGSSRVLRLDNAGTVAAVPTVKILGTDS